MQGENVWRRADDGPYAYLGGDGSGVRRVTVTDPAGRATTTWYDENGRAVRQTGGGVTVAYRYDYMGNQTVAETLGGAAGSRMVRAEYDSLGNRTADGGRGRGEPDEAGQPRRAAQRVRRGGGFDNAGGL